MAFKKGVDSVWNCHIILCLFPFECAIQSLEVPKVKQYDPIPKLTVKKMREKVFLLFCGLFSLTHSQGTAGQAFTGTVLCSWCIVPQMVALQSFLVVVQSAIELQTADLKVFLFRFKFFSVIFMNQFVNQQSWKKIMFSKKLCHAIWPFSMAFPNCETS